MTSSDAGGPGVWAASKTDRATAHYADLKARIDAWFVSDSYRLETVIADDRFSWQLYLRVDTPPPLVEWATILGDCLHNLRSALDAAVWELAHRDGATPTNPKQVQFPFCELATDWPQRLKGSLAGLPADLLTKLEAVQPYNHTTGEGRVSALSLLNALDIEDKHKDGIRAEIRAAEASSRSQIRFESEGAAERHVRPTQHIFLELIDGALLHSEATSDPILEVRGDFDATVHFAVDTAVGPTPIWKMLDLVFQATINTLEHLYTTPDLD